jgi:hypothetical protein
MHYAISLGGALPNRAVIVQKVQKTNDNSIVNAHAYVY